MTDAQYPDTFEDSAPNMLGDPAPDRIENPAPDMVEDPGPGTSFGDALIEFFLTAVLLFVIVSAVWWVFRGRPVAGIHLQLAVVGLIVAVTMGALILSPWGRRSGAHANPAVTVGLWLMGSFRGAAVPGYLLAQLAGSVAGTGAARLLWGREVASPAIDYGLARAAPDWTWWQVFLAEAGTVFAVLMLVGFLLSRPDPRMRRLLPYALPATVALVIVGLGPLAAVSYTGA